MAPAHDGLKWPVYMHTRRLITFLQGLWFALLLSTAGMALLSPRVADNISKTPPDVPARSLNVIGEKMTGQIFVFVAVEIQRTACEISGWMEIILISILAFLLFIQNYSRMATVIAGVLFVAATAAHFLITPQMIAQSRTLDFRPDEMMLLERARLANLNLMYAVMICLRLLLGAWMTGVMIYRGPNSRLRRRTSRVDAVDDAENSHVDR